MEYYPSIIKLISVDIGFIIYHINQLVVSDTLTEYPSVYVTTYVPIGL